MSRPEHLAPPDIFYNETEAKKYAQNSRMIQIQSDMARRAIELLNLDDQQGPFLILDVGCGSGLCGQVINEMGWHWMGFDISPSMLSVAMNNQKYVENNDDENENEDESDDEKMMEDDDENDDVSRSSYGDLFLQDMGQGVGFRPGSFDGCISISALQWLCNVDTKSHSPIKRITRFFSTVFCALRRGARAIFQFYPENSDQISMLTGCAMRAGFTGGLVVDFPHSSKAKKYYLCLFTGPSYEYKEMAPRTTTVADNGIIKSIARNATKKSKSKKKIKDRKWVLKKKELARRRGKLDVPHDSKYTGRKRKDRF